MVENHYHIFWLHSVVVLLDDVFPPRRHLLRRFQIVECLVDDNVKEDIGSLRHIVNNAN